MSIASDAPLASLYMAHGELLYASEGQGMPVVAVHGLPGSVRDFRRLGVALKDQRVRLIRLNLPGFGGSAPLPRKSDSEALVQTIVSAAQALAGGPHVLLGHSYGCHLALRVAAASDQVQSLALLAPLGLRPHRAFRRLMPAWAMRGMRRSSFAKAMFHRALSRTGLGAHVTRMESDCTLALLSRFSFDPARSAAKALRIPALTIYARDDELIEPAVVEELATTIHARRLAFDSGGHMPQREHAAAVATALVAFAIEAAAT
jgi:pimeloyl-ACP methyl ester carboxylesterase